MCGWEVGRSDSSCCGAGSATRGEGKMEVHGNWADDVGRWYSERNVCVRATRPDSHGSNDVAVSGYVEYHLDVLLR
jgi:hypothetical protein